MPTAPAPRTAAFLAVPVAALAWPALGLQLLLMFRTGGGLPVLVAFLSFFTILSNILVALVATAFALGGKGSFGHWLRSPRVCGAAALYIAVTGIIYAVLLAGLWQPVGPQWWADVVLHYAVPVLYVAWWLLFAPRPGLGWNDVPRWLVFPAVYLGWSLLRGSWTHAYPYPFVDPVALGWPRMWLNAVMVAAGFVVLGLLLVAIDRIVGRRYLPAPAQGS
jgi:hypothetical protein